MTQLLRTLEITLSMKTLKKTLSLKTLKTRPLKLRTLERILSLRPLKKDSKEKPMKIEDSIFEALKKTILIMTLEITFLPAKVFSFLVMVYVRVGDGNNFSHKIYGCRGSRLYA